jgi:hypothetical protein
MEPEVAASLDTAGVLPPGCLYVPGRFAFELQTMSPEVVA